MTPETAQHLLRVMLIEEIPGWSQDSASQVSEIHAPEPVDLDADRVAACSAALDRLCVPRDAGAPRARLALRDAGEHWSNDLIAAAVRSRKSLSGTAADEDVRAG